MEKREQILSRRSDRIQVSSARRSREARTRFSLLDPTYHEFIPEVHGDRRSWGVRVYVRTGTGVLTYTRCRNRRCGRWPDLLPRGGTGREGVRPFPAEEFVDTLHIILDAEVNAGEAGPPKSNTRPRIIPPEVR